MRQIPFINQLCSHPTLTLISIYIQNYSSFFFHVVFTSCLETLYICYLGMRSSRTAYFKVQGHFEVISFSMLYAYIGSKSQHGDGAVTRLQPRSQGLLRFQDGGRHLESGVDPGNEVDTTCIATGQTSD